MSSVNFNNQQFTRPHNQPTWRIGSRISMPTETTVIFTLRKTNVAKDFPIFAHGILGRDFLVNYECHICLKTWLLTFNYQNEKIELSIHDKFEENFIIPSSCQIIKEIKLHSDSIILSGFIKPGIFYSNALVDKNIQYINIMNTNNNYEKLSIKEILPNIRILSASGFERIKLDEAERKRNRMRIFELQKELNTERIPQEAKSRLLDLCAKYNDVFALVNDPLTANNFYRQVICVEDSSPV